MGELALIVVATLLVSAIVVVALGERRWRASTRSLLARLEGARIPAKASRFDAAELQDLPAPVRRYLRTVLKDGQPIVTAVDIEHAGTFNASEAGERWSPFTSVQRVLTQRPGFLWAARISMFPGLAVLVHDAYVGGEGLLHASVLGVASVADLRGTSEVAHGELMRFAAEAAWYPTALLPSQGAQWEAVDDTSARLTLRDGPTVVTLLFRFGPQGLIDSLRAESRSRTVGNSTVALPWEGRWSHYETCDGMLVPVQGEVAWMTPEGPKPYWRGRITKMACEFAR